MTTTRQDLHFEIREYPPQDYLGIEFEAALTAVGESVAAAYSRIFAHLAGERIQPAGPPFLIASPPAGGSMRILAGVPTGGAVSGSGELRPGRLAGGGAAVTTHRGPYEQVAPVRDQLRTWLTAHGHVPAGPPREVYLNGPGDVASPADYLTELVWPIA